MLGGNAISTALFPSLPGITWPVKRTAQFSTNVVQSASGREVRVALQSQPFYMYEISYEVLRINAALSLAEYPILMAFFNNRQGMFDTFLYNDTDDNSVTAQAIGVGNGFNTSFQLVRAFGGSGSPKWVDIILAPNVVTTVKVNNVTKTLTTDYTINAWGTDTPGTINFVTAPSAGQNVTADFTWYWPCRFLSDTIEISKIYQGFYSADAIKFRTIF